MHVLGVWDGHDAGAALLEDNRIIYAANEERFTKRKLEINFPTNAINAALRHARIRHSDVTEIAFTTTEFTKTLERIFPQMKESYYKFRRRKMLKPSFENFRHNLKYTVTSIGVLPLCNSTSSYIVSRKLRSMGFKNFRLHVVDHHTAHAATAAFTAPFRKSTIITLDGLGDGLSGSVSTLENGKLKRHSAIAAKDSLGMFYEQVTNILGMRELEDEGKIMAMADYSYPFPMESNELRDFFSVVGTTIRAKYNPRQQFDMLQRIAWQIPREQFAYMAQQVSEHVTTKFTENVVEKYGIGRRRIRRRAFREREGEHADEERRRGEALAHLPAHGRRRHGVGLGYVHELPAQRHFRIQVRRLHRQRLHRGRDGGGAEEGQLVHLPA